jgi:hypothetical protein
VSRIAPGRRLYFTALLKGSAFTGDAKNRMAGRRVWAILLIENLEGPDERKHLLLCHDAKY